MQKSISSNPLEHTANIKEEFKKLSEHLREDVEKVDDPQAKALFEVSAEVIDGLEKAFNDYERKNESAWINSNPLKG
jgi:molecular chaperone GrpE (heat shock protein)